jgi:hypothetical protein
MKHCQRTVAVEDWEGEFGSYNEWRDLDRNPQTGVPLLLMRKTDVALLNKILFGHGTTADFQ